MNNSLDGKSFTRTVVSEGHFGQPKGNRSHTVSFRDGYMEDTASCFFGCPPKTKVYQLRNHEIFLQNDLDDDGNEDWVKSGYIFQDGEIIYNGTSKMIIK